MPKFSIGTILFPLLLWALSACAPIAKENMKPLTTVSQVDLNRYLGEWYEIARYPNRFQDNCPASKATYTLRSDGRITVLNECWDADYNQMLRSVRGTARVVDPTSNAKLKVTFFWPFSGDYWIIDLGKEYQYAVVGHPERKYLWILGREKTMDGTLYQEIVTRLAAQDYDPTRLIRRTNSGETNNP
ncbi:MAG: lipocalin family protein [Desulfobulbaceae bacterium]|nr:lipocalin family protein [Desulfobulbaceae bacterium]